MVRVQPKPQLTIIEKVTPALQPTPSVRIVADKVVMADAKIDAKVATITKTTVVAKVKADEVVGVRIKANPKADANANPATKENPTLIILPKKAQTTEGAKPAQGQPVQE